MAALDNSLPLEAVIAKKLQEYGGAMTASAESLTLKLNAISGDLQSKAERYISAFPGDMEKAHKHNELYCKSGIFRNWWIIAYLIVYPALTILLFLSSLGIF